MNAASRKLLAFGLGGVIALAAWAGFRSRGLDPVVPLATPSVVVQERREPLWDTAAIKEAIAAVAAARTDGDRMAAIEHLSVVPLGNVQEALELVTTPGDSHLSLEAKVLLIRWANGSGPGATGWAWARFATNSGWEDAFRQIGPAWAWHDFLEFGKWLTDVPSEGLEAHQSKEQLGDRTVLSYDLLSRAAGWLIADQPRTTYQIILNKRRGYNSEDSKIASGIPTVAKAKEALQAFQSIAPVNNTYNAEQLLAGGILKRWKEIDPVDFRGSEYAALVPDRASDGTLAVLEEWRAAPPDQRGAVASRLVERADSSLRVLYLCQIAEAWMVIDPEGGRDWMAAQPGQDERGASLMYIQVKAATDLEAALNYAATVPPATGEAGLVRAFDIWRQAHPGQHPDFTRWSAGQTAAWQDLEALCGPEPSWDR